MEPTYFLNEQYMEEKKRTKIMVGVFLGFINMMVIFGMIIPATSSIITDLGKLELYSMTWTAFLLTSTIVMPLVGKLGDIFGKKIIFILSVSICTAGSFFCGLAQNMEMLIVFRGLQGFGAGLLIPTGLTIIGEIFRPQQRAKYLGLYGTVAGASNSIFPTLGGVISIYLSWRWIFFVSIPIGIISLFIFIKHMPGKAHKDRSPTDFIGTILISITTISLILTFSLGGQYYSWNSPIITTLIILTIVSLAWFFLVERRSKEPLIPFTLFKYPVFIWSSIGIMLVATGIFEFTTYFPLYSQVIRGFTAVDTGIIFGVCAAGMSLSSYLCGLIVSKTGRLKEVILAGVVLLISGTYGFFSASENTAAAVIVLMLFLKGLGMGPCVVGFILAVQNGVPIKNIGVATGLIQYFQKLGGTIGLSILSLIFNARWTKETKGLVPESIKNSLSTEQLDIVFNPQMLMNEDATEAIHEYLPESLDTIFPMIIIRMKEALGAAIQNVYFYLLITLIIAFTILLIINIDNSKKHF